MYFLLRYFPITFHPTSLVARALQWTVAIIFANSIARDSDSHCVTCFISYLCHVFLMSSQSYCNTRIFWCLCVVMDCSEILVQNVLRGKSCSVEKSLINTCRVDMLAEYK